MTNKCPTCFEPLISDSKNYIVTTPCGHLFHMNCIQGWLDTGNQTCPQCRGLTSKDKLLRIYLPPTESDVPKSPPETLSSTSVAYALETNSVSLNSQSNSARLVGGPHIPGLLISNSSNQGTTRTNNRPVIRSNQEDPECDGCSCSCCCCFLFVLFVVVMVILGIVMNEKEKNWLNEKNSVSWWFIIDEKHHCVLQMCMASWIALLTKVVQGVKWLGVHWPPNLGVNVSRNVGKTCLLVLSLITYNHPNWKIVVSTALKFLSNSYEKNM